MKYESGSFTHGVFIYLFGIHLIKVVYFEFLKGVILPNDQFSVNTFRSKFLRFWLVVLSVVDYFFALKNIHNA